MHVLRRPVQGPLWVTPWTVMKCFSNVGITQTGVDFLAMNLKKLHDDDSSEAAANSDKAVTADLLNTPRQKAAKEGFTPVDATSPEVADGKPLNPNGRQYLKRKMEQWHDLALHYYKLSTSPLLPNDVGMCDVAARTWHTARPRHLAGSAGYTVDESTAALTAENPNRYILTFVSPPSPHPSLVHMIESCYIAPVTRKFLVAVVVTSTARYLGARLSRAR